MRACRSGRADAALAGALPPFPSPRGDGLRPTPARPCSLPRLCTLPPSRPLLLASQHRRPRYGALPLACAAAGGGACPDPPLLPAAPCLVPVAAPSLAAVAARLNIRRPLLAPELHRRLRHGRIAGSPHAPPAPPPPPWRVGRAARATGPGRRACPSPRARRPACTGAPSCWWTAWFPRRQHPLRACHRGAAPRCARRTGGGLFARSSAAGALTGGHAGPARAPPRPPAPPAACVRPRRRVPAPVWLPPRRPAEPRPSLGPRAPVPSSFPRRSPWAPPAARTAARSPPAPAPRAENGTSWRPSFAVPGLVPRDPPVRHAPRWRGPFLPTLLIVPATHFRSLRARFRPCSVRGGGVPPPCPAGFATFFMAPSLSAFCAAHAARARPGVRFCARPSLLPGLLPRWLSLWLGCLWLLGRPLPRAALAATFSPEGVCLSGRARARPCGCRGRFGPFSPRPHAVLVRLRSRTTALVLRNASHGLPGTGPAPPARVRCFSLDGSHPGLLLLVLVPVRLAAPGPRYRSGGAYGVSFPAPPSVRRPPRRPRAAPALHARRPALPARAPYHHTFRSPNSASVLHPPAALRFSAAAACSIRPESAARVSFAPRSCPACLPCGPSLRFHSLPALQQRCSLSPLLLRSRRPTGASPSAPCARPYAPLPASRAALAILDPQAHPRFRRRASARHSTLGCSALHASASFHPFLLPARASRAAALPHRPPAPRRFLVRAQCSSGPAPASPGLAPPPRPALLAPVTPPRAGHVCAAVLAAPSPHGGAALVDPRTRCRQRHPPAGLPAGLLRPIRRPAFGVSLPRRPPFFGGPVCRLCTRASCSRLSTAPPSGFRDW